MHALPSLSSFLFFFFVFFTLPQQHAQHRPAHRYWCLTALLWGIGEASSHFRLHCAVLGRGHWTGKGCREGAGGRSTILPPQPSATTSVCRQFAAVLDRQGGGVLFLTAYICRVHWAIHRARRGVRCNGDRRGWVLRSAAVLAHASCIITRGASHLAFCLLVAQPEHAQRGSRDNWKPETPEVGTQKVANIFTPKTQSKKSNKINMVFAS